MTLFNGLLCISGDQLGCDAVMHAQDVSGRWHRSPRLAADPTLRPKDSFSWDMALGVQLYVVKTGDRASLQRWLAWVESSRPCLVETPLDGKKYCLVRGWPRWCTDDTEGGCSAKPQNLATLIRTIDALGLQLPPAAEDVPPTGIIGDILRKLQDQAREANAALSLGRLLEKSRNLQPSILLMDSLANEPGFSRHLAGVEILLSRRLGLGSEEVNIAATVLALKEKNNPFFQYLWEGPSERVRQLLLSIAPKTQAQLPMSKRDWAWQRTDTEQAWKSSNLWDFQFAGRLVTQLP
ncbi:hypothetical protein [Caballeronia sp. GaOx3]|uniref:hypothetical protein n=1 Tax=Caballeronia sp. GaOx3 TaxID=2921740 RepID=UPI002028C0B5|nr:hypothetical protein [Caballeronia sp. GaOx3]